MDAPRVQYARTTDGVNIAFSTLGSGPPVLITATPMASHLRREWDAPERRASYEALAQKATVIRYDPRGVGMSQEAPQDYTLEEAALDLDAVLDEQT